MHDITPFTYGACEVRTLTLDGDPWFVASDVAKILGYSATSAMTRTLEDDERGVRTMHTPSGDQEMTIISEAGLYSSILRSRVVGARAFKRWITHEVLPAIRKTGSYGVQAPALPGPRELAQMVIEAEDRADALAAQVEAQRPAVDYHQRFIAEDDDIITVDNFAAQHGLAGHQVRDLLVEKGLARRKLIGERWSRSKGEMEQVWEWRAAQGARALHAHCFALRPQHNAPRHHNGQVRQTLYVVQWHAQELARVLGIDQQQMDLDAA